MRIASTIVLSCIVFASGCSSPTPTRTTTSTVTATPQAVAPGTPGMPTSDASRLAYGVGFDIGRRAAQGLDADGMNVDADLLARGFSDAVHGLPSALPPAETARVMRAVHRQLLDRTAQQLVAEDAEFRQIAEQNAARSAAALAAFRSLPGATTLNESISYVVVAAGSGRGAAVGEVVVADFVLTGADGREIERRSGVPVDPDLVLPSVGGLLRSMKPGDRWRVAIASESAYGLGGDPPRIGPNEALFADVTVLELRSREATP